MAEDTTKEVEMAKPESEETPEEEKNETPQEEQEEEKEGKEFSLDAYLDVSATLAFLEEETEDASEMSEKIKMAAAELKKVGKMDYGVIMGGIYSKMCKMSESMKKMEEDKKVYLSENAELKKFKADIESEQKKYSVDSTMKELEEKFSIPEDVVLEMRSKAESFEFSRIDDWKNIVKAKAVDFAINKNKKEEEEDFIRFDIPFRKGVVLKLFVNRELVGQYV